MGRLERRVSELEERFRAETALPQREAWDYLFKCLTTDEFRWLSEPPDEAQCLVPCPHVEELASCGCRSDRRRERGFEAHPELVDEYVQRRNTLLERTSEIMGRVPR